jgi:carbon monoxide dehydrogenase subunit G
MTRLQSEQVLLHQSQQQAFDFLSDFENIGKLMPEQVEDFKTEGTTCSFNIKGMASLGLSYASKSAPSEIVMAKNGKAPFDFNLICSILPTDSPDQSKLQLFLDADLNPFLKMMAEKPLTNFLNMLAQKYSAISSNGIG